MLSPFLPHSANQVDVVLGGAGDLQPMPVIAEVEDLDGGAGYPVITGDYTTARPWRRVPVTVGAPVVKPQPVFTKLDPSVVEEELARLEAS
jgi:methionyl-tRNA synthetase